jgi:hypothetical protein
MKHTNRVEILNGDKTLGLWLWQLYRCPSNGIERNMEG